EELVSELRLEIVNAQVTDSFAALRTFQGDDQAFRVFYPFAHLNCNFERAEMANTPTSQLPNRHDTVLRHAILPKIPIFSKLSHLARGFLSCDYRVQD